MEPYNHDLLQDAFYHLDNLKFKLTELKLEHNRNRELVYFIDDLIKDCDLIQLIIQSYDKHNFRHLCNIVNHSFTNPNCHGVILCIPKKRFARTLDKGKMDYINFPS
jgi:hypothetical protein